MLPAKKEQKVSPGEGVRRFFRNVMAELKKVNWPTRKELINYTIVVVFTVLVVALIIFAWDSLLTFIFKAMGFYR